MEQREVKAKRVPEKRAKGTLHHLEIHKASNGGHIVKHFHERRHPVHGYTMQDEEKQHVFGPDEGDKALLHIAEHAGISQKSASPASEDE